MEKPRRFANLSKTQAKKRRRRKYPNVFFKKEMVKLFDAIDNPRTMVASFLTFFCALRLSETCRMKWIDIDLEEQRLKVVEGKNYKDGFVPLSPLAIPILKNWRKMHPDEEYVFPTNKYKTGYYQPDSLYRDYKKALKRAGLLIPTEKTAGGNQQHQYKFHTLRHSRCTHLLNNNVPVEKVQKFMRHDKMETTMVYTWIMDKELNKMVMQADTGGFDTLIQPKQERTESPKANPLEIAKRRLAYGEISIREYNKIKSVLSGV